MKRKLLSDSHGLRTFVVVFETGEDPVAGLRRFAAEHRVDGASVTGIGAFSRVVIGYFGWEEKRYRPIPFEEQMEVLALTGNIGVKEGDVGLHLHVTLGRTDGTAHGGHLLEATVRPTLEMVVTETPAHLRRRFDEATGLHLIDASL